MPNDLVGVRANAQKRHKRLDQTYFILFWLKIKLETTVELGLNTSPSQTSMCKYGHKVDNLTHGNHLSKQLLSKGKKVASQFGVN